VTLNVLGAATTDKVTLMYSAEETGDYTLCIYDIAGRMIHTQNIAVKPGTQSLTINDLHLTAGMYLAKMSNGNSASVAKMMVQ